MTTSVRLMKSLTKYVWENLRKGQTSIASLLIKFHNLYALQQVSIKVPRLSYPIPYFEKGGSKQNTLIRPCRAEFQNSLKSVRHTVVLNYHICSVACKLRCCLTYVHRFVPFSQHSLLLCVDGWEKLSWRLRFYFTKDIIENEREKGNFGEITIEFLQRVSFCAKWNRMRMTGKLIFLIEKTLKYGWAIHFCK